MKCGFSDILKPHSNVFLPTGVKLILILSGVFSNVNVVKKKKKKELIFFHCCSGCHVEEERPKYK